MSFLRKISGSWYIYKSVRKKDKVVSKYLGNIPDNLVKRYIKENGSEPNLKELRKFLKIKGML